MTTRPPRTIALLLSIAATLLSVQYAPAQNVCTGVSPVLNTTLTRVIVASGLTGGTSGPLFVTAPPDDTKRIMIVMQNGIIRQLLRGEASTASTVFMDISARVNSASDERGLLGLAFSPTFAIDGTFYVNYTRLGDGHTIVSRFKTFDGTPGTNGDPASETILFRIVQPESNHNGGWMSFGPDGFLYVAQGDGGGGGDGHGTCGNGQNTSVLLGKILRIDPTGAVGTAPDCGLDPGPYTIPPGNPLANGTGVGPCDEIWAYGVRNPWRDSFDTATGDLYIGDVGQGCWEEVNWAPSTSTGGENYGWRLFEGRHCYNPGLGCTAATSSPAGCGPACSDPLPTGDPLPNGTVLPIWDYYSNNGPCTVIGGYSYRGCRMPNLQGTYFYGDYCAGSVLSFRVVSGVPTNHQTWTTQLGTGLGFNLTSFGTDAQGELYIVDRRGSVYMTVPPLPNFEVAGVGATGQFLLNKVGDWTWENLQSSSRHPISAYRVYRADVADGIFDAGEIFNCVRTNPSPTWPLGGDPAIPSPDQLFAYVVTALNGIGEQTSPGGTPVRTLGPSSCP